MHEKHVDEERQYVQNERQKGQNWAPNGLKLNTKMVQKLSKIPKVQFFTSICYGFLRGPKTWQLIQNSAPGGCQEQNSETCLSNEREAPQNVHVCV